MLVSTTSVVLLHQQSRKEIEMKKVKVGIIGSSGKYGKWLQKFFEKIGCQVIGSDIATDITNRHVVEQSAVVIFAVPIGKTVSVINEISEFGRESQLFMDVTSIKGPAVGAMLRSKANVVGLHPMCAPTDDTLHGQVIVRCDARLTTVWSEWVDEVLKATEARVKISTPEEHDRNMAIVQGLTHATALIMASVVRTMKIDVAEINDYVSPPYRVSLSVIGRILSQNPVLYEEIQMSNPGVLRVLEVLENEAGSFRRVVEAKDKAQFESDFESSRKHFGEEVTNANEFFLDIIKFIAESQT
jgi:prephenate dehydrogenase